MKTTLNENNQNEILRTQESVQELLPHLPTIDFSLETLFFSRNLSNHPLSRIETEEHIKIEFPLFVISPHGPTARFWAVTMSLILLYLAWVYPFRLSFEGDFEAETYFNWIYMDAVVDFFF